MMLLQIRTPRLELLPYTKTICEETMNGSTDMLDQMGLVPGAGWPDADTLDTVPRILNNLQKVKSPSGFESWMIIAQSTRRIVGDVGFKGLPNEAGEIDLGYGVIEGERRKGFAIEAAIGILDWAFDQKGVKVITASCRNDNFGSQKILTSLHL